MRLRPAVFPTFYTHLASARSRSSCPELPGAATARQDTELHLRPREVASLQALREVNLFMAERHKRIVSYNGAGPATRVAAGTETACMLQMFLMHFGVIGLRWSECVLAAACRSNLWTSVRPSIHGHISSGPESVESRCTVRQHGAVAVSLPIFRLLAAAPMLLCFVAAQVAAEATGGFSLDSCQLAKESVGLRRKCGRVPDPDAALGRPLGGPHWSCARCQHCRQENRGEVDCFGQPDHDHVSA